MRLGGLWRHPDFLKFWAGQTVSVFGSQVTLLALPLTAALTLEATPGQMGLLAALGSLPGLVVGLPVGVWVDRHRRRPVLFWTNAGRAVILAAVPAAAAFDALRIELLYAVALAAGGLSGLVGSLLAGGFVRRFGLGRSMLGAGLTASVSQLLMLLAAGPPAAAAAVLIASRVIFGLAVPLLSVNILSLQQAATPPRLLGRVNATVGVMIVGTLPLGALAGGALGTAIGLRSALAVGVIGIALSPAIIWWSPLRSLREPPAPRQSPPASAPAG